MKYFEIQSEKRPIYESIKILDKLLNVSSIGVKFCFNKKHYEKYQKPEEHLRFCEAIKKVRDTSRNYVQKKENISCPAARFVLGFEKIDGIKECVENLVEGKRFINMETAVQALEQVPRIQKDVSCITLSKYNFDADIFLYYLRPVEMMTIVQAYQRLFTKPIRLEIPGIVPICGGCTVRPYITQIPSISFGCLDSSKYGGINYAQLRARLLVKLSLKL